MAGNVGENNYFLLSPLMPANADYIRKINQLSLAKLENDKAGGDIFRAIDSALLELDGYLRSKKAKRRVFLFTNGMGRTEFNAYSLINLGSRLKMTDTKLNVITINFMGGYNIEENQLETEEKTEEQTRNADLLMELKKEAPENVQILPDEIAIELYRRFRRREVNPVAIFKGELVVAPDLTV